MFGELRTALSKNGEPLFCLSDVCKALGLSGNLVGISINLCKSIQKELFINDTP